MTGPDPTFATIADIAPQLESGDLSPRDLLEAHLNRIEALDGDLNCYITLMADSARRDAERAEADIAAGQYRGPLHGIPVAVKDLFATKDVTTTFGSPLFKDWVPDFDATVVERLRAAGAVIIGKTNLHELAFGTTSANPHFGAVHNPWNRDYHVGGSSGGSAAALAAGLAMGALGSDTAASIRHPAHCCGVVGLKATYGRISKFGGLPLSWAMDHAGPMTRSVRDAAIMLTALAGPDSRDPNCAAREAGDYCSALDGGIAGARLGVLRDPFFSNCDDGVLKAVTAAIDMLEDLGATVEDLDLPDIGAAPAAGHVIIMSEGAAYHAADMRERPDHFSDEVRAALEMGGMYTAVQYHQAQRLRRHLMEQAAETLAGFDGVLLPTSAMPATPIETAGEEDPALRIRNTLPFNFLGLPAISVPCGFTGGGLPVGLQIAGKAWDEASVLRIAHAYEQASKWHKQRPPLD